MNRIRLGLILGLLLAAGSSGCSAPATPGEGEEVSFVEQAVNACNETIPANRSVDGLPAYAQCSGVSSGNIWSNNGIDTATTSGGSDWIQTQRGGGYQCTEWAYRYMRFRWNVSYRSGDAKEWCAGNLPSNLVKSTVPVHGDLIVFDGGVCGSDATTGHIAVIDVVNASAQTVTIVEENQAGRRNAKQSCALCFLHAVANDGTAAGAGGGSGSGSGGTASAGSGNGNGGTSNGGMSNGSGGFTSGASGGRSSGRGGAANGGGGGAGGAAGGASSVAKGGSAATGGTTTAANGGNVSASAGSSSAHGGAAAQGGSGATVRGGETSTSAGAEGNPVRPGAVEASCSCAVPGATSGRGASSGAASTALLMSLGMVWRRRRRMQARASSKGGAPSKGSYAVGAESPPR